MRVVVLIYRKGCKPDSGGLSVFVVLNLLLLVGCQGASLVKDAEPVQITQPMAVSADAAVAVSLYWVIVRNGPGMWVEDADWDEYLIGIANNSQAEVRIDSVILIDSLGTRSHSETGMKQLVKGSKRTVKRYEDEEITIKSGYRPATLYGTAAVGGAAAGATIAATSGMVAAEAGAAVLVTIAAVPILVGSGIYRGHVNKEIDEEIDSRATTFPVEVPAGEQASLDLFFPLAPSPRAVEIRYTANEIQYLLSIDTAELLRDLHLPSFGADETQPGRKSRRPGNRY